MSSCCSVLTTRSSASGRMTSSAITNDCITQGTWDEFSTFLFESFGSVAPDREARAKYNKLKQTGTVSNYVQETRNLVRLSCEIEIVWSPKIQLKRS